MANNVNPEIQSAEDYQKKFDERVEAVLSALEGLSIQKSQSILEAAIYRLPAHSCVQSLEALQLGQPN
jgi:hypothetical protein